MILALIVFVYFIAIDLHISSSKVRHYNQIIEGLDHIEAHITFVSRQL